MSLEAPNFGEIREQGLIAGLNEAQQDYLNKLIAEYEEHFGQIKLDELEVQINRGDRKARQIYMDIVDKIEEIVCFLEKKEILKNNRPWHLEKKPIYVNNSLHQISNIVPVPNSNNILVAVEPSMSLINQNGEQIDSDVFEGVFPSNPVFDPQSGNFYAYYPEMHNQEIGLFDPKNGFIQEKSLSTRLPMVKDSINMQVSPNGRWLAIICDYRIEIIDTNDLQNPVRKRHLIALTNGRSSLDHQPEPQISFSPDSENIYVNFKSKITNISHQGDNWGMDSRKFGDSDGSNITSFVQSEDGKTIFSIDGAGFLRACCLEGEDQNMHGFSIRENNVFLPYVKDLVVAPGGQELVALLKSGEIFSFKNSPIEGKPDWSNVSSTKLGQVPVGVSAQLTVSAGGNIIYLKSGSEIRKIVRK